MAQPEAKADQGGEDHRGPGLAEPKQTPGATREFFSPSGLMERAGAGSPMDITSVLCKHGYFMVLHDLKEPYLWAYTLKHSQSFSKSPDCFKGKQLNSSKATCRNISLLHYLKY